MRIEKSDPRDHCLASLGKASWCHTVTLRQTFLSTPHTNERFLNSSIWPPDYLKDSQKKVKDKQKSRQTLTDNKPQQILVCKQFSAGSKSGHTISKKLSMKVFFPQLVSDQRLEGCQIVVKENCSKLSTLWVLHTLFPDIFHKSINSGRIMCARACHMLQHTYLVRWFLPRMMFIVRKLYEENRFLTHRFFPLITLFCKILKCSEHVLPYFSSHH